MCQEAGEVLQTRLGSDAALDAWNASYCAPASNRLTTPLEYFFGTPIQLIASRDMYIGALVEAAVAAQSKIQIATCYVFWDDPAHRYVLMDLLPHLVRTKGVKVQLLLDLLVVESFTLRSALTFPAAAPFTTKIAAERAQKWATSFVQHLPSEGIRPPVSDRQYESPFHFLQSLLDVSRENADLFQVQFWCARDSREHYRIKSHVKCAVFDRQVALIGGSNVTPTVKSAFADLDALLAGKAASAIGDSFDTLWNAMSRQQHSSEPPAKVETEAGMSNPDLAEMVRRREWQDPGASVAILRSSPSSGGEDAILRVVLDKIRTARSEVVVCMGHSSYCRAFAKAVEEAASLRGVRVRILVNSLYSNDLRNGQADLFVSLRDLLAVAPSVEVYATTLPHFRDPSLDCNLPRPDFIHAKYVVVDREWSATGSWNLWTRSAFYEIEHEAFIQSPTIAGLLSDKFERDRLAHSIRVSAKDCTPGGPFCPRGCILCEGFGPFFKNRRNAVAL
jgi:phosphatidylserine/phosphatidylglycerophosphate/cardiolipin synthase-like enzyme